MSAILFKTDDEGTRRARKPLLIGLLLVALGLGFGLAYEARSMISSTADGQATSTEADTRPKRGVGDMMVVLSGQNLLLSGLKLQVGPEAAQYSDAALRDLMLGMIHQALHMPVLQQDENQITALRGAIMVLAGQQAPWLEQLEFQVSAVD